MINFITVDIESTGLDPYKDKLLLIGYRYDGKGDVVHIDFKNGERGDEQFKQALADPEVEKRGHNVKFDLNFLRVNGYEVNGPLDDTSVLCYLENPFRSTSLKELVREKLNRQVTELDDLLVKTRLDNGLAKNRKVPYDLIKLEDWKPYNAADVTNCDDLREAVYVSDWYVNVEQPLAKILFEMESRGMQLDVNYLTGVQSEYALELSSLEQGLGGLNARSPKQVAAKFAQDYNFTLKTTDKLQLKRLTWKGNPLARTLLRHREISKLDSTYVSALLGSADSAGRIHGSFNQAGSSSSESGTRTGRLTSSGPNLQNIPSRTKEGKRIRRAFIPTPGFYLIDSDLKQIEPRLVAHFSQSPKLLKAFASGVDTHGLFASDIFEKPIDQLTKMERFIGKTSWLATVYGCYYKKLLTIAETNSEDALPSEYDEGFFGIVQYNFWRANPEIATWRNQAINQARALGYIRTIGGRVIYIDGLHSKNRAIRNEAERQVVNYTIQGSAADIMKLILVKMGDNYSIPGVRHLLATVHDEILCEVSDMFDQNLELERVNNIMCNTVFLDNVKIEADTKIISNWSEK